VVHCAGVLADATVETLTTEQVEQVFAPKVDAAQNLHELTEGADLSTFALFSSASGTLGGPGQANYAAANVFLDALAQKRQAQGLAATSIAWGLWQREGGMVGGLSEADLARMRRGGIEPISDEQGLALFDAAIGADRPQALALPIETAALRAQASAGALPPILSGLVRAPRRRSAASGSLATKLAALPRQSTRPSSSTWSAARSPPSSATAPLQRSSPARPSRTSASTRSPRSNCATGSTAPPGSGSGRRRSSTTPTPPHLPGACSPRRAQAVLPGESPSEPRRARSRSR